MQGRSKGKFLAGRHGCDCASVKPDMSSEDLCAERPDKNFHLFLPLKLIYTYYYT